MIAGVAGAVDLLVDMAVAGRGTMNLIEDWLASAFGSGTIEPVLPDW